MLNLSVRDLWLARNTIIEMLTDRGYIFEQSIFSQLEDFKNTFNLEDSTSCNFTAIRNVNDKVILCAIHFTSNDKLSKKQIETIITDYSNQSISKLILISCNKLNHAALAYLDKSNFSIELFLYKYILFNPTKHILVPHHKIMSIEEKTTLLNNLKCSLDDLPIILKKDVIAKYLGAELNDVIEITRKSKTTGESKYYRVVKE